MFSFLSRERIGLSDRLRLKLSHKNNVLRHSSGYKYITLSLIYNGSFFYAVGKTTTIYEIGQTQ